MSSARTSRCRLCGEVLPDDPSKDGLCQKCRSSSPIEDAPPTADEAPIANSETPSSHDLPDRIGPYKVLDFLGEGGMGAVYLAEQEQPIRRKVALKVIKLGMDTKEVIARFESERQALAMMNHPNIAQVHDAGTTERGAPYFVMEYVPGVPITDYCDRHRLSTRERLEIFIPVCHAVQHAHQKGIIHRDVKPSNILVSVQDGKPVPKIIDFGVAKATNQRLTESTVFTQQGYLIGTPEYMSPEQAEMTGLDVDTTTDIYSLGVLLYELLVGALPFDPKILRRAGFDEIRRIIREVEPPKPITRLNSLGHMAKEIAEKRHTDLASLEKELGGDLEWITLKSMEKDRTRRYASSSELAADIERHLRNEPVIACPASAAYRLRKFVRRHRVGVAAIATIVLLIAGFAVATTVQARRIARERDRANREATVAKQVSDFLVGLFKVSDPSEARGSTLTAREILEKAAKSIERSLNNQPEVQARLQKTIGAVYTGLGMYSEAQPLLQRAVDTYRRVFGEDDPETLTTAHELANLYWFQEKYKDAEPIYLAVVDRRRKVLGDEHPDTLKASFDLASLYIMQKRWDKGEPLAVKTMQTQRRVLGPDHPDTQDSLNNIQGMYYIQGRYAEAEPIAIQVLDFSQRALGEDHPDTLRRTHNLATIQDALGRFAEAEALFLRAIGAEIRVLGKDHPDTVNSESYLASMYQRRGLFAKCEPLVLAVYETYSHSQGAGSAAAQRAAKTIVNLYTAWGKPAKAAEWRAKLAKPGPPR